MTDCQTLERIDNGLHLEPNDALPTLQHADAEARHTYGVLAVGPTAGPWLTEATTSLVIDGRMSDHAVLLYPWIDQTPGHTAHLAGALERRIARRAERLPAHLNRTYPVDLATHLQDLCAQSPFGSTRDSLTRVLWTYALDDPGEVVGCTVIRLSLWGRGTMLVELLESITSPDYLRADAHLAVANMCAEWLLECFSDAYPTFAFDRAIVDAQDCPAELRFVRHRLFEDLATITRTQLIERNGVRMAIGATQTP